MCQPQEQGVEEMPVFVCSGCGINRQIEFMSLPGDTLRAVLHCRCKERTYLEIQNNAIKSLPGTTFGSLKKNVCAEAKDRYTEAKECFYATTLRASVVMARSAIEAELKRKGYNKGKLRDKIEDAHKNGLLGDTEYTLAQGSRLIGNQAIHKSKVIKPEEVVSALGATAIILNNLKSVRETIP